MIAGALFLWLFLFRGQAFSWKRASLCVCASGASLLSALFLVPEKHWLCHGLFLVLLAITWIDVHELWIPDAVSYTHLVHTRRRWLTTISKNIRGSGFFGGGERR